MNLLSPTQKNIHIKSGCHLQIKVITKLPNSEQSYKGKVKTHNYINRQIRQQLFLLAEMSVQYFENIFFFIIY